MSQPQTSHAASTVVFGVDGAEFLFNWTEVGHEIIKVYILPLIQRLCRQQDVRQDQNREAEEMCVL